MKNAIPLLIAINVSVISFIGIGIDQAYGQALIADDVIILSKGQRAKQMAKTKAGGDGSPGSGASLLPFRPGELGKQGSTGPAQKPIEPRGAAMSGSGGVLSAASGYDTAFSGRREQSGVVLTRPVANQALPQYGTLEMPSAEDEGPSNGMSLDLAIDRLLQVNPDLLAKSREIPKAQADALTAGLRANPIVFFSADNIPYGSYSPRRPGDNSYGIVLVQPIDINGKRKVRVIVAEQARKVIEAQYQDAVRFAIDNLATVFVDMLEARDLVRYKEANLKRLKDLSAAVKTLHQKSSMPRPELDRVAILHDSAEIELQTTRAAYRQTKQALGTLLQISPLESDGIEIRGSIRDTVPAPPLLNDLVGLALCNRPDLVAYRFGIKRAEAEVRLAKRERFEDVFLFYTPYGFANYAPVDEKSATSWGLGGLVSIPLFNRNQGNIARANETVIQTKMELSGLERMVVNDVQRSFEEYQNTRSAVQRLEKDILPRSRRMRDDQYRLFAAGEQDITAYYNAERDHNEIVRQYRDTLVRHRRSMLKLNTSVGQRILP